MKFELDMHIFETNLRKMRKLFSLKYGYRNFGKMSLDPFERADPRHSKKTIEEAGEQIHHWAKEHGARYFSFLAFPHTEGIAEKQDSFLRLSLAREKLVKHIASEKLSSSDLIKGEGDGSSFPNGGLRQTSAARGYFVWDWRSPVFIRRNGVLYIPALLINHNGQALDDKTLYRKAETFVSKATKNVLKHLGHQAENVLVGLGLEQEFFIIPKKQYSQRLDLHQTGRALLGRMPPHEQQFSDHYYSRLEPKVEAMLSQAEDELLQIGVPIKTRHKEVAPNQYQMCAVFEDASRCIDQNMIKMRILEEACDRYDLVPLWHEKPFSGLNGSGKHMNWSLQFYTSDNTRRNLFIPKGYDDETFILTTLITLKALLNNQKLYLASVAVPGNEIRLGGHQAPPRIISAFVGKFVTNMLEKLPEIQRGNLRNKVEHLLTDVQQANTDRNRTSPYGFASNRFEYRAVGSSQNCYFPMSVILTTIGQEMVKADEILKSGVSVQDLINRLVEETAPIRFEGDGYAPEWPIQAKKRGLYVNERYTENLENIVDAGKVLVESGVYKQSELQAKANIAKQKYIMTVLKEVQTLMIILNKNILPRAYNHVKDTPDGPKNTILHKRRDEFILKLNKLLDGMSSLEKKANSSPDLATCEKIRSQLDQVSQLANDVTDELPNCPEWPELYQILRRF